MSWFGKLAGGALGLLLGGPIGAALGTALGHHFDQSRINFSSYFLGLNPETAALIRHEFLVMLFQVMGHLAKSDGYVSEAEIGFARHVMRQLQLSESDQLAAMRLFNEGKNACFDLAATLKMFRSQWGEQPSLIRLFMVLETKAGLAEQPIHPEKERILLTMCQILNFSDYEYYGIKARLQTDRRWGARPEWTRGQPHHDASDHERFRQRDHPERSMVSHELQTAYAVLGISALSDSQEIKRAYRRAISRYHPDKLTASGGTLQQIQHATQMTQKIQKAYTVICNARSIYRASR